MAKRFQVVLFLFLALCGCSSGLSILHGTIECRSQCERTFPLHTYPTTEHYLACQRGCYRALRIKGWSHLGIHLQKCSEGCKTTFSKKGSVDACNLGCDKGHDVNVGEKVPSSSVKTTPAASEQHGTVAAMLLRPVMMLHTYGRGMINKLTYYVQSSTSYYFRTSNGGMMVVNIQDEPRFYVRASNPDDSPPSTQEDEPQKQNGVKEHNYEEHRESWIVVRKGNHWLHCVSHRSGIPMWILTSVLFLSTFILLWLCCAGSSSSPSTKKPTKKAFLIKDFLSDSKEKDGQDAPLLDLSDDDEAKPLPSKTGAAIITI